MGLSVIVCSRREYDKEFVEHLKSTCGVDDALICFVTNQDNAGLGKVYNHYLQEDENPNDVTVFVHDDVEFLKDGWGAEILRLFEEHKDYGIIGVAGSAQFDENGMWWNYEKKYGQVLHRDGDKSWLTMFSPLLDHDLEEVCCVDGLFIAVHRDRITKRFDESFTFDFYDIDLCVSNFEDKKTKIGVTTNIRMAHKSVGKPRESWEEAKQRFLEKHKGTLPINMPKSGSKKNGSK